MQEAEEAAAAEVLKLQQELEMEEAGLQPHPEQYEEEDEDNHVKEYSEKSELQSNTGSSSSNSLVSDGDADNQKNKSKVPESFQISNNNNTATIAALSDLQSYQLYVQATKPSGSDDLNDANIMIAKDGAYDNSDNNSLFSHDIPDHSLAITSDQSIEFLSRHHQVSYLSSFLSIMLSMLHKLKV